MKLFSKVLVQPKIRLNKEYDIIFECIHYIFKQIDSANKINKTNIEEIKSARFIFNKIHKTMKAIYKKGSPDLQNDKNFEIEFNKDMKMVEQNKLNYRKAILYIDQWDEITSKFKAKHAEMV